MRQGLEDIAEEETLAVDGEETLEKSRVSTQKTNADASGHALLSAIEDYIDPAAPSPRSKAAAGADAPVLAVEREDSVLVHGSGERVVVSFSIPGPLEEDDGGGAESGNGRAVRVAVLDPEAIRDSVAGVTRGVELKVNRGAGMEDVEDATSKAARTWAK